MTKKEHDNIIQIVTARAYAEGYKKGYSTGYADGQGQDVPNNVQMYTEFIVKDGDPIPRGYRFGEEWVGMQLSMEGGYDTEEEAYIRWYKEMIHDDPER